MPFLSTAHRQVIEQIVQSEQTPFFVYDLDGLLSHLKPLTEQSVVKLWYAVKANPLSKVIQTLDQAGFDFDVASSGELDQVIRQGVCPSRVLNTGPAKSKRQIQHFLSQGVRTFVAESHNQVHWLNQLACEHNVQLRVLLRVQLRWPDGEKNPLGGDSLTPFGLGTQQWQSLDITAFSALEFIGLHIFQWGNMLSTEKLTELWSQMVPPLLALADNLGFELQVLDLGGGLGIPYVEQDAKLAWPELLDALASIKATSGVKELWMELGRFAVGEYGHYANPVVEQKQNYGEQQLIVAGGINHILRPAVTNQAFPCELLRTSTAPEQSYLIHGPLCTALDHLGRHTLPQDIDENDWLVFSQCGAYGFTESMPYFLCHELPAEYVIEHGKVQCVRHSLAASEYLR
ncbi:MULTISPECIES: PLP-dependent decarboxylase [Pseudoalteromonas]|uniref:Diaminopimelate decarboxylase n=1 Tax=Pseudoalteromonas amylolytica TaxID=1859457 RepID=A0A1S1MSY2_9GAMM|nr:MULTISPECIES: PLP-dependent decarboxylase [Pseudoalteromonas]OHU86056.1 diaminopimelate decarboxylase [Pseudoalteromonas sp. JW3]OHU89835.1 diaminopimelate decarboxylase [Pseudoalteromonas amylolytica]